MKQAQSHLPRWLTAAVLVLVSLPAFAQKPLQPFTAQYKASYMGMQATGTMTLSSQGANRWSYDLGIRNQIANLSQQTVFEENNGQLRPLSSSDSSTVLIKRKAVKTKYDWNTGQATWSGDVKPNQTGPVKLQPGDMDALLINLALVRDVQAGRPLNYRMVENGRIKPMSYRVVGEEKVTFSGQTREATKVARIGDSKREIIAWVVPDLPVPVRLLQRENGQDVLELTLQSFK